MPIDAALALWTGDCRDKFSAEFADANIDSFYDYARMIFNLESEIKRVHEAELWQFDQFCAYCMIDL
jgi:hypothetical protein